MALFIYKAKKGPVEIIDGEMQAASQDDVVTHLINNGLVPVSIVDKNASLSPQGTQVSPALNLPRQSVKLQVKEIDIFTRQMASLIKSGVPMLRALSLISQQSRPGVFKDLVASLEQQIREGSMLSQAMEQYPLVFNHLFINMIKSGEKGGSLDEALSSLAQYREKEQEIRQKVQAALAYPLLTLTVGIITVFVMLTFFLPKFTGLFEGMKRTLPLSTRILIGISHFMAQNWIWFIMAAVFVLLVLSRSREGSKQKALLDLVKLHLPVVKKFVKDAEVAKFARTLSALIRNGISVVEALELATDVMENTALRDRLAKARGEIIHQGSSLSVSLQRTGVLPEFAINMISVGEEGGKLAGALKEISDLYEMEVDQGIKIMTSLLEPMLMLVIGSIVGFMVFAMLLPIFDIEMNIH